MAQAHAIPLILPQPHRIGPYFWKLHPCRAQEASETRTEPSWDAPDSDPSTVWLETGKIIPVRFASH